MSERWKQAWNDIGIISVAVGVYLWFALAVNALKADDIPSVVVRVACKSGNVTSHGSGVLFGQSSVLTAWHVIRDRGSITVTNADGTTEPASVLKTDTVCDLAALRVSQHDCGVAIASTVTIGEPLWSAGYGGSGKYLASKGKAIAFFRNGADLPLDVLCVSGQVRPGDSGGAIFNSSGECAGILWGCDAKGVHGCVAPRVAQFVEGIDDE